MLSTRLGAGGLLFLAAYFAFAFFARDSFGGLLSAFFFGLAYPKVLPLSSVVQSATRGIRGGSLSAFRISTFVLRMAAMAGVDVSLSRRAMAANLSHLSNRHLP
jgi:hypothetical protein